MVDSLVGWLHERLTWGNGALALGLFAVTLIGSVLVAAFLLVYVHPLYFQDFHSRDVWVDRHPVLRLTARVVKNVVGLLLVGLGIVLSLPGVPGQGILTILVGLMLLEVPGKRRLERRMVGRPRVLRAVNRLRRRFGRPPLVLGARRGRRGLGAMPFT